MYLVVSYSMKILLLIILTILPVFLIGLYIYKKDSVKEPKKYYGNFLV